MKPTIIDNLKAAIAAVEAAPALDLGAWRSRHDCGTLFCIGGLIAVTPHFKRQGVYANKSGAPYTRTAATSVGALEELFGTYDDAGFGVSAFNCIFSSHGSGSWDADLRASILSHKDLALARLRRALALQEAK